MKKPKVVRAMARALACGILVLTFCAAQRSWSQDDSSTTPANPPVTKGKAPAKEKKAALAPTPAAEADDANPAPAKEDSTPQYVGAQTCISCHQDNGDSLLHSAHGRLMEARKGVPFDKACETCHGPGSLHVEFADNTTDARFHSIKFPPKLPAAEANAICLSCHEAKAHFHWQGSPHDLKNVACISCHTIHQKDVKNPNKHLLKAAKIMDVCFTCHLEKKAQISRNGHMPLNENEMTCTSCHDMHGTSGDKNLKADSVRETCFQCHADKRGPFLFEHPPAQESCLNCHNPHGTNNNHMLVERAPFLCLRCHTPHAGYGSNDVLQQGSRMMHEGCLNCHSNIHGSNHPSGSKFQR